MNPDIQRTICVIDDDPVIRLTTQKLIHRLISNYHLLTFEDGEQAINFFKENIGILANLPQLIFVDINMPVLNGWQFLDQFFGLKNDQYAPVVYVVSSSVDQRDLYKATTYPGLTGYWTKPMLSSELSKVLITLYGKA